MDFKQTYFPIWQDVWNLHKKYALLTEEDLGQWENLTMEANQIHEKYADTEEIKFVEDMLVALTTEIDRKAK